MFGLDEEKTLQKWFTMTLVVLVIVVVLVVREKKSLTSDVTSTLLFLFTTITSKHGTNAINICFIRRRDMKIISLVQGRAHHGQ